MHPAFKLHAGIWTDPFFPSRKRFRILPYFRRYGPFRTGCFSTSVQDLTGIKALQYPCSADPSVHSIPYPIYHVFNESLLHLHSKGIRGSSDRRRMQQLPALHTDHPSYQPVMASCAIVNLNNVWNVFLFANVFLENKKLMTIPLGLMTFQGDLKSDYVVMLAGILIASLPMVLLFLCMSKQFVRGLTSGAVKG